MSKLLAEWFWTDRWSGSTAFALPLEARGLYREMLTQAWRRGARLPNDPAAIRRLVGATAQEWRRAWPAIEKYWTVEGRELVNATQVEIYRRAQTRSQLSRAKARARWDDEPGSTDAKPDAKPMQNAMPNACKTDAERDAKPMQTAMLPISDHQRTRTNTRIPNPPAGAGGKITRAERNWAENARRVNGGKCPHDNECSDRYACLGRLVGEKRAAETRGLLQGIRS